MIQIGYIDYINSLPFWIRAQEEPFPGVEISKGTPAQLNQRLREGLLQLSAVSAYEVLAHSDQYLILPQMGIHSKGIVQSVILFSKKTLEDLNGENILLTLESATSINLLKILLSMKGIVPKAMLPMHESAEKDQARLLIGDAALRFDDEEYRYHYDLAEMWLQLTGLPVVFALWAVRRDLVNKESETIRRIHRQLLEVQRELKAQPKQWAEKVAQAAPEWDLDFEDYFSHLDFSLDESCVEALRFYEKKLQEIGELPGQAKLEFYS